MILILMRLRHSERQRRILKTFILNTQMMGKGGYVYIMASKKL